MNIGIDIDDTITNTFETALPYAQKYVREALKKDIIPDYSKAIDHHYIRDIFGLVDGEDKVFWIKNYYNILDNVEPKENSCETIRKLKEEGNRIIIISARWDIGDLSSYNITKEWLDEMGIHYDKLITGIENKAEIALQEKIDIFIDDSIRNCLEVQQSGIKSLLMTSPVNRNNPSHNIERVFYWEEIYKRIKNLEKEKDCEEERC